MSDDRNELTKLAHRVHVLEEAIKLLAGGILEVDGDDMGVKRSEIREIHYGSYNPE